MLLSGVLKGVLLLESAAEVGRCVGAVGIAAGIDGASDPAAEGLGCVALGVGKGWVLVMVGSPAAMVFQLAGLVGTPVAVAAAVVVTARDGTYASSEGAGACVLLCGGAATPEVVGRAQGVAVGAEDATCSAPARMHVCMCAASQCVMCGVQCVMRISLGQPIGLRLNQGFLCTQAVQCQAMTACAWLHEARSANIHVLLYSYRESVKGTSVRMHIQCRVALIDEADVLT